MSFTIWFTGLSGSGKSTQAALTHAWLASQGVPAELLDGDVVRRHLCADLGYCKTDRDESVRRIAKVSAELNKKEVVSVVAAIAPYRLARHMARERIQACGPFIEVFCDCPLEVLTARDPKGLYKRALAGEIPQFTGLSDPYERPERPDLRLPTDAEGPQQSHERVRALILAQGLLAPTPMQAQARAARR